MAGNKGSNGSAQPSTGDAAANKTENGHFSRLPAAAIYDSSVSAATLRVLAALGVYADRDGLCFPSTTTLARRLGLSRQGVQYHIKKLERLGYVMVSRRRREDGMNRPNLYQLVYPALAAEPSNEGVASAGLAGGQAQDLPPSQVLDLH